MATPEPSTPVLSTCRPQGAWPARVQDKDSSSWALGGQGFWDSGTLGLMAKAPSSLGQSRVRPAKI